MNKNFQCQYTFFTILEIFALYEFQLHCFEYFSML